LAALDSCLFSALTVAGQGEFDDVDAWFDSI
jgi:hypothetical protein